MGILDVYSVLLSHTCLVKKENLGNNKVQRLMYMYYEN